MGSVVSKDVQAHRVARRVVQDAGQVIEAHHLMEPVCQLMEQCAQVPVRDDRCRDRQQGWVLLAGGKRLCSLWEFTHDRRAIAV